MARGPMLAQALFNFSSLANGHNFKVQVPGLALAMPTIYRKPKQIRRLCSGLARTDEWVLGYNLYYQSICNFIPYIGLSSNYPLNVLMKESVYFKLVAGANSLSF